MKRFSILMAAATAAVAWGAGEQTCGGSLRATPCPEGSFCSFNLGECAVASVSLKAPVVEGVCKSKPEMCTQEVDPVCGCDGVTYNNNCAANLKGVSVKAKGECTKEGGLLGDLLPGGDVQEEPTTTPAVGTSTTECGGPNSVTCAADYVCIYEAGNECGHAGGLGHCEPAKDMMCTTEFEPVCGCDGKTYSNACVAQYQHGVSVKAKGECDASGTSPVVVGTTEEPTTEVVDGTEPVPEPVGDEQGSVGGGDLFEPRSCTGVEDHICGLHAYCRVGEAGTQSPTTGTCTKKPLMCPAPPMNTALTNVCGYDGTTYKTECLAQKAGVSVRYRGACFNKNAPPPANSCGGKNALTTKDCGEGFYCKYDQGICSLYDSLGVCSALPEVCTSDIAPVCGCNGVTFSNACKAGLAGISVKSQGECPPVVPVNDAGNLKDGAALTAVAGGVCKPSGNVVCPEGYYCAFSTGTCGTDKDAEGLCVVQPATCTPDPASSGTVCGCDGHVWATKCDATMAGVSLKAEVDCSMQQQFTSGAMGRVATGQAKTLVLMVLAMVVAALALV